MTDNELICQLANALRMVTQPIVQPVDLVDAGRALDAYKKWKRQPVVPPTSRCGCNDRSAQSCFVCGYKKMRTPVSDATDARIAGLQAQARMYRDMADAQEKARRDYEGHRFAANLAAAKLASEEAQWCAAVAFGIAIGGVVASVLAVIIHICNS